MPHGSQPSAFNVFAGLNTRQGALVHGMWDIYIFFKAPRLKVGTSFTAAQAGCPRGLFHFVRLPRLHFKLPGLLSSFSGFFQRRADAFTRHCTRSDCNETSMSLTPKEALDSACAVPLSGRHALFQGEGIF